jgi:hypothetical protein
MDMTLKFEIELNLCYSLSVIQSTPIDGPREGACMCICISVCLYACMLECFVYMYVYVCVCLYVCMCDQGQDANIDEYMQVNE